MTVQWVHLGEDELLIASQRGAWIQPLGLGGVELDAAMPRSQPGTPETTRYLLDGAIAAAERGPAPLPAPKTTARWAWELVNQWYVATHSIALLAEARDRYAAQGRADLAAFTNRRLAEERGHEQFPLDDLTALGYEAERAVSEVVPATTATALIDYATQCVHGSEPIEFLGYIHAMERHVIRLSADWFRELDGVLPSGVDAASGLRAHVSELDIEHVNDAVAFFSGLPADDRAHIATGCYRATLIRMAPSHVAEPSEQELLGWFAPFRTPSYQS